jgi:hypothetical protein
VLMDISEMARTVWSVVKMDTISAKESVSHARLLVSLVYKLPPNAKVVLWQLKALLKRTY